MYERIWGCSCTLHNEFFYLCLIEKKIPHYTSSNHLDCIVEAQAKVGERCETVPQTSKRRKAKDLRKGLFSKKRACKLVQLSKPSRNKPTSKLLCLLCKLNTTCSWFSNNKLLEAIPIHSSCNLYICTYFFTASCNAWWKAQEFFMFRSTHKKSAWEALTVHKNQRLFSHMSENTKAWDTGSNSRDHCFWWWSSEIDQSSIIWFCCISDVHLVRFILSFCPKMKSEPSIQSTLWIKKCLISMKF
jgi:hypothetical protein